MLPFFPIGPIIAYPHIWIEERKINGEKGKG
jgi:hypothetical protein